MAKDTLFQDKKEQKISAIQPTDERFMFYRMLVMV